MTNPLMQADFAALMAPLGPFADPPHLAVAVSGGADSTALAVLLADWCRARGGRLLALTVDHGLRPESAAEALTVGRQMQALGVVHRILRWRGVKPSGPVQEAARAARYALLGEACRRAGLLQLALAHHEGDQAETLLLRLAAGSGLEGLAAMAAVTARPELLLLRPLLAVPRRRLVATLEVAGLPWQEDPSNADRRHRRVALRQALPRLADAGLPAAALADLAHTFGRLRRITGQAVAGLLARTVAWHPAGFARIEPRPLLAAPEPLALRALGEVLRVVGGRDYAPGPAALQRLLRRLAASQGATPGGATLGGCRLLRRSETWLVAREETEPPALDLQPGRTHVWDGRFRARAGPAAPRGLVLRALGRQGWQGLAPALAPAPLPGPVLWSLPALYDQAGPLAVPALSWRRPGTPALPVEVAFAPRPPAASLGFTVA